MLVVEHFNLKLHHFGCLTENSENSILNFHDLYGNFEISDKILIQSQQVFVQFLKVSSSFLIELVEPIGEQNPLNRLLKKQNFFYHTGFTTTDIDNTILKMETKGYKLINKFSSEAFNNNFCAFLYSSEMHLVELIQIKNAI